MPNVEDEAPAALNTPKDFAPIFKEKLPGQLNPRQPLPGEQINQAKLLINNKTEADTAKAREILERIASQSLNLEAQVQAKELLREMDIAQAPLPPPLTRRQAPPAP